VCSPAKAVRWSEEPEGLTSRLNNVLIDRYAEGESAGYPTLCQGRFMVNGQRFHPLEEPTSLNTLDLIPELEARGGRPVTIARRARSPGYGEQATRGWRPARGPHQQAPRRYAAPRAWREALAGLSEGSQTTLGAYPPAWQ